MMMFIEKHNLFSDKQFGFRQNHSTEQMLLSVLQEWKTKLDSQTSEKPLMLLLHTLGSRQFSPSAEVLLESYLINRSQIMEVGESKSNSLPITCRVTQGSILGPILFNQKTSLNKKIYYEKAQTGTPSDSRDWTRGETLLGVRHRLFTSFSHLKQCGCSWECDT